MKKFIVPASLFLVSALAVTGCSKEEDIAYLEDPEFESIETTELAQLPQQSSATQQMAMEILPIETSPVTQGMPAAATEGLEAFQPAIETDDFVAHKPQSYEYNIQKALKNAGFYEGKVDGKIGPMSRKAIKAFQKSKGLKVDGKVGAITWAALEPYLKSGE